MCRTRGRMFKAEKMAGAKALWWEQSEGHMRHSWVWSANICPSPFWGYFSPSTEDSVAGELLSCWENRLGYLPSLFRGHTGPWCLLGPGSFLWVYFLCYKQGWDCDLGSANGTLRES